MKNVSRIVTQIGKIVTQIAKNYKFLAVESKPKKNSRKTKVRKTTLATRIIFHIEPMIFVVPSMNVTLPVRDACQDNNTSFNLLKEQAEQMNGYDDCVELND